MTDSIVANFDVKLTHVFDVRMNFHQRLVFGPHSSGSRLGYVSLKDGLVRGPRLNGRLLDYSGADFGVLRQDNVLEADAHYMFETDDGALIQVHNRGYIYNTMPNAPGPPYFRAPSGPHDWLNRTVIVGGGERHTDPDHTLFRYYAVD